MAHEKTNSTNFNVFKRHGFRESPFHPLGVTLPLTEEVPFPVGIAKELCKIIQWIEKTKSYVYNDLYLVVGEYGAGKSEILKYIKRYIERKYNLRVIYTFLKYPLRQVNKMIKNELEKNGLDPNNLVNPVFIIIDEADDFERDLKAGIITGKDLSKFIKSLRRFLEPVGEYESEIPRNVKLLFGAGPHSYNKMNIEAVEVVKQRIKDQKIILKPPEEWQVIGFARRRLYFYANEELREILKENPYFPFTKGILRTIALISRIYHPEKKYSLRFASQIYDKLLFYSCETSTGTLPRDIDYSVILELLENPENFGISDEYVISHFKNIFKILSERGEMLDSEEKEIFFYLFADDEPKSPKEIAEKINMEIKIVEKALSDLEEKSLVEKCFIIRERPLVTKIRKIVEEKFPSYVEQKKIIENITCKEYNVSWDNDYGLKDMITIFNEFFGSTKDKCSKIETNESNEIIILGDFSSMEEVPPSVRNIVQKYAQSVKYRILPRFKKDVILKLTPPRIDQTLKQLIDEVEKSSPLILQSTIIKNISGIISSSASFLKAKINIKKLSGTWSYIHMKTSDGIHFLVFFLPEYKLKATTQILEDFVREGEKEATTNVYLILFYGKKKNIEAVLRNLQTISPVPFDIRERIFIRELTFDELLWLFGYNKIDEEKREKIRKIIENELDENKKGFLEKARSKGLIIECTKSKIDGLIDVLKGCWKELSLKNEIPQGLLDELKDFGKEFIITKSHPLSIYEKNVLFVFKFYKIDSMLYRNLKDLVNKIFIKKLCKINPSKLLDDIMIDIKHILIKNKNGQLRVCLPSQKSLNEVFQNLLADVNSKIREVESVEEVGIDDIILKLNSAGWFTEREIIENCKKKFRIFIKEVPEVFHFDDYEKFINQVVKAGLVATKIYSDVFSDLSGVAERLDKLISEKRDTISYIRNIIQYITKSYTKLKRISEVPREVEAKYSSIFKDVENLFEVKQLDDIRSKLDRFSQELEMLVKGGEELKNIISQIEYNIGNLSELTEKIEKFRNYNKEEIKLFLEDQTYLFNIITLPKEDLEKIKTKITTEISLYYKIKPFVNYYTKTIDFLIKCLSEEVQNLLNKVKEWIKLELYGRLNWIITRGRTSLNKIKNIANEMEAYKKSVDSLLSNLSINKLDIINLKTILDCRRKLENTFKELFREFWELVWYITRNGPGKPIDKEKLYSKFSREVVNKALKELERYNLIAVSYIT